MKKFFKAAIYVRLSKEDDDLSDINKAESNSISNQKRLITDFVNMQDDIDIYDIYIDDGYSGSNFNRPGFQRMIKDVEDGSINCIIVKDLSRFGREYIDTGKYLEKVFPSYGLRFISINDNYDSLNSTNQANEIVLPFKNLLNDWYCADISKKIRSHQQMKRKNGDFIGSFAPYGYKKNDEFKNQLEIDDYAAGVVEDIFNWKISGFNLDTIANKLNDLNILSPLEYKVSMGYNYSSGYKTSKKAKWSAVTIRRILQNEVYIGTLVQGKKTTPNHKVKKVLEKDKSEWIRVENTHEPIISKEKFNLVQKLLAIDTRTSPNKESVYLFSGIAVCGDCGSTMTRKLSRVRDKEYVYYLCSANKKDKSCSAHRISEKDLSDAVLATIKMHVNLILDMRKYISFLDKASIQKINIKKLDERRALQEKELKKNIELKTAMYSDFKLGILSKKEYLDFSAQIQEQIEFIESSINIYNDKINEVKYKKTNISSWINIFRKYKNINTLSRNIIVELIDKILVYEGKKIEIQFVCSEEYELLKEVYEYASKEKGVV